MDVLRVKRWTDFQHYKHRNPPWIKLHAQLLDDYDFHRLPDPAKAHLMGIWLLASRTHNAIPMDATWIAAKIGATSPIDLQLLINTGFVERASNTLATCVQNADSETETETEAETETIPTVWGEQSPAEDPPTKRWNTVLAPIIRDVWWSDGQPHQPDPDGKPWTMDRDMSLLKVAVARGRKVADLEPAIRGLRLLRKTGAVDARLLTDGNVWRMAIAAYYDADNKPRKPKANPMQKYLGAP